MGSDLYERLKRIRSTRPKKAPCTGDRAGGPEAPRSEEAGLAGLADWHQAAPLVFVRETTETLPAGAGLVLRESGSRLVGRELDPGTLCFMDTETTGLSGGAGTTVFLVGAGRLDGDVIRVRQTLLADFPGEPSFLEHVGRDLAGKVWVSYNGKAFDAKLLESRFLMNGMPPPASEQLDLLAWSRRLWRRALGSCSLADIERGVLDRGRTDDIPGIEIPERYFRFLRERNGEHLHDVFEHHRLDVVSLVHLFFRVEAVLRRPQSDASVDRYRLGRWLLYSDQQAAVELLEGAAATADSDDAVRAALLLSRVHRRHGRHDEALRVLRAAAPHGSREVLVETAKVLEHACRDPQAARKLVESYLESVGEADASPDLLHRLARLHRKSGAAR